MNVSITIPNYNGETLLKKNLPKVIAAAEYYKKQTIHDIEIIVVDDCSDNQSVLVIKQLFPEVIVLQNEKNLGFALTVNKGVKKANGEIVVLLNSDVAPEKDFLMPLMHHFEDKKVFAVGCMDKSIEGSKIVLRGRGIGYWHKGFLMHKRGEVDKTDTLWVNGGSGAFRKSLWEKLGGFDPLYKPFYWEDIDLSYRALKSGYKLIFEPKSIVIHEHEKGAIKQQYSPTEIKKIAYRNQFLFVWKNVTDVSLQFSHFFWLPYHFMKAIFSSDSAFFAGFFAAIIRFPQSQYTSLQARRFFVKHDYEVTKEYQQ